MLRVFFSISCGWWFLCILRFIKLFNCHQHSCTHPIYTQFMTFLWLRSQSSRSSPKTITTMCSLNFIFFLHNGSAQYLMVKSQFWAVGCWDLKEMRNNLTCFWNAKNCQTWDTFMGKFFSRFWHCLHFPHDLFSTQHRPNLNEKNWECEPATEEAEDGPRPNKELMMTGQFPHSCYVLHVRTCSFAAVLLE